MKQLFNPEIWLVERKAFNPGKWLHKPKKRQKQFNPIKTETGILEEVEVIVRRTEALRIDLTMNYEDWLKMGFAFSSEFGETGRDFFHRISRFYSGYDRLKTDQQFDKCLKGRKTGTTIKTFFAAAYDAGVNVKV